MYAERYDGVILVILDIAPSGTGIPAFGITLFMLAMVIVESRKRGATKRPHKLWRIVALVPVIAIVIGIIYVMISAPRPLGAPVK